MRRPTFLGIWSLAVLVALNLLTAGNAGREASAAVAIATFVAVLGILRRSSPGGLFSPVGVYIMLLGLFHLGTAPFLLVGSRPPDLGSPVLREVIDIAAFPYAMVLSAASIAAVGLGATVVNAGSPVVRGALPARGALERQVATAGTLLMYGSVSAWTAVAVSLHGFAFVGTSYAVWLSRPSPLLPYIYFSISLAVTFLAVARAPWRSWRLAPLWFFAAMALPIGLRNEVLIPLLVSLSLRAVQGTRLRTRTIVSALLIGLVVTGLIRDVRIDGLRSGLPTLSIGYAGEALAEAGYSLQTVALTRTWQNELEDPLYWGGTYWAPVERLLDNLLPFIEAPGVPDDVRASETLVVNRGGAIGFSSIAEAARNFPDSMVVMVLFLQGALLAWLTARAKDEVRLLALGLVLGVMLSHARNSFTPVPLTLLLGGLVIVAVARRGGAET